MGLQRWISYVKRKPRVIPEDAVNTLSSWMEEDSKKLGVPSPSLVLDPRTPGRKAFYRQSKTEVHLNSRLLARTWRKEGSLTWWRAAVAHELGHHFQKLRRMPEKKRWWLDWLLQDRRRARQENEAWEITEKLTGIAKKQAVAALSKADPSYFRLLLHWDLKTLHAKIEDEFF